MLRNCRALPSERRLAAAAAAALFVTLFLPWYQETVIANGINSLRSMSASLTGWAAFSFVEAAILLVAAGVITLLFIRAEGGAFHVPGGDGGVITAAGVWTCVLIIWRMFDKEGTTGHGQYATTSGIEWGIFVALAMAGVLTYAGTRIRQAHEPEPPLPGDSSRASAGAGGERGRLWRREEREPAEGAGRTAAGAEPETATRRAERVSQAEADETWRASPGVPADPGPRRHRVRPRSVAAGLEDEDRRRPARVDDPPQ